MVYVFYSAQIFHNYLKYKMHYLTGCTSLIYSINFWTLHFLEHKYIYKRIKNQHKRLELQSQATIYHYLVHWKIIKVFIHRDTKPFLKESVSPLNLLIILLTFVQIYLVHLTILNITFIRTLLRVTIKIDDIVSNANKTIRFIWTPGHWGNGQVYKVTWLVVNNPVTEIPSYNSHLNGMWVHNVPPYGNSNGGIHRMTN